jgi:phytoene desaturase
MNERHLVVVGGGLAGLSAGCYALRSGYRVTIIEHNLALGGVCTAWHRGRYTVDGCIQWLTGGPFQALYEELGITARIPLRTLETWLTYRNVRDGLTVAFRRDLDQVVSDLSSLSKEDAPELARLREAAREVRSLDFSLQAPELTQLREKLHFFGEVAGLAGTLLHFRKPVSVWAAEHLVNPRLRRIFTTIFGDEVPAVFLLLVLGYLERGWLSRPVGGTAAFREVLENTYVSLGGAVQLHVTVDEILVRNGRAAGVRLADGTMLDADVVISTSSAPETVLRLLGGRYDAAATRRRLEMWKLVDPIVLASFGVERPYTEQPQLLTLDGILPLSVGGRRNDHLHVRVQNDDRSFAPPGHSLVQATALTDYGWWARRGTRYHLAKDVAADAILEALEPAFPEIRAAERMRDVVTPLTYWNQSRSWLGAYEGWIPRGEGLSVRIPKRLPGLEGFYMAGQWLEPGGGVPMALMSGRQAVQLLCSDDDRPFVAGSGRVRAVSSLSASS